MKNDLKGLLSWFRNEFTLDSGEFVKVDNNLAWMLFVDINTWKPRQVKNTKGEVVITQGWDQYSATAFHGPADMANMYIAIIDVLAKLDTKLDGEFISDFAANMYAFLSRHDDHGSFGMSFKSYPVFTTNFTKFGFQEYLQRTGENYYKKLGYRFELRFLDKKKGEELYATIEEFFKDEKRDATCSQILSHQVFENLFSKYNSKLAKAKTGDAKLEAIIELVQNLEQMHPLNDKNCRTFCVLLFNFLLIRNGFGFVINFDPNRFDGYSVKELVELTKISLERTKFLISNLKVVAVDGVEGKGAYELSNPEEFDRLFNCDNVNLSANDFMEIINNPKAYCSLPNILKMDSTPKALSEILEEMSQESKDEYVKHTIKLYDNSYYQFYGIEKVQDFNPSLTRVLKIVQDGIEISMPRELSYQHIGYNVLASAVSGICTALLTESYVSGVVTFIACDVAGLLMLRNNTEVKVNIAV